MQYPKSVDRYFQYLPPTLYVWLAYSSSIVALFGTIKCVNHALHCVYDTTECLEEPGQSVSLVKSESEKKRAARNKRRETPQDQVDLGIELQVLNGKNLLYRRRRARVCSILYYR